MNKKWNAIRPSRRAVLAGIGASVAAPAILRHSRAYAANPVIKVGHVSPRTGPLAGFAEEWPDGHDVTFAGSSGEQLAFQVGTERGQVISTSRLRISVEALGLSDIDLRESTGKAIVRADAALDYINSARAELGAAQSRLESAIASNEVALENVSAARSRIRDADIASQTAELTRSTILQQAAVAMLAQANSAPRQVLQLLQ